mmetsp:Transcript_30352/g.46668  ORF Transcript_30352/g.46668 Transcript_30352/m.46668 type:complete len:237 (-) Transcript_30352:612-1322(-)
MTRCFGQGQGDQKRQDLSDWGTWCTRRHHRKTRTVCCSLGSSNPLRHRCFLAQLSDRCPGTWCSPYRTQECCRRPLSRSVCRSTERHKTCKKPTDYRSRYSSTKSWRVRGIACNCHHQVRTSPICTCNLPQQRCCPSRTSDCSDTARIPRFRRRDRRSSCPCTGSCSCSSSRPRQNTSWQGISHSQILSCTNLLGTCSPRPRSCCRQKSANQTGTGGTPHSCRTTAPCTDSRRCLS